jgi:hypothetical protein
MLQYRVQFHDLRISQGVTIKQALLHGLQRRDPPLGSRQQRRYSARVNFILL